MARLGGLPVLLFCLSVSSIQASVLVTFTGDRTLTAESIVWEDGRAIITLSGGGRLSVEAARVVSAVPIADVLPQAPPGDALVAEAPQRPMEPPAPSQPPSAPAVAGGPAPGEPAGSIARLIRESAARHGVDAELLRCVILVESGNDPAAVSPKGAMGLAQLMPATARDLGVIDPFDPAQAVDGAARLLRELLERNNGKFVPTLAAYNAGGGAVHRWGGLPPYRETIDYIERVLTLYAAR